MSAAPGYFNNARPELLPLVPKNAKRILELGCGEGAFARTMLAASPGTEYWGVEADRSAAVRAMPALHKVLDLPAEQALTRLPDEHFDLLICNDVLEHLVDPGAVLAALRSKLTAQGRLFLSIPNVRFLPVLLELLWKKDWQYQDAGVLDRTHLRFYTEKSLRRLVEQAGYRIERLEGINSRANWAFRLGNLVTLGCFRDTQYPQFVLLARRE